MEPQELAALLGQEIDAGFAAALNRPGASLRVSRIIARLGNMSGTELADADWQAEAWLYPRDDGGPIPTVAVSDAIAALPVVALRGLGPGWEHTCALQGITQIGHLAEADLDEVRGWGGLTGLSLAGKARAVVVQGPWKFSDTGISALEVARRGADSPEEHARRAYAVTLLAHLDAAVLQRLHFA